MLSAQLKYIDQLATLIIELDEEIKRRMRKRQHVAKQAIRKLESLGYKVMVEEVEEHTA